MSDYQEERRQNILAYASYGTVSPPPLRGYVIMAIPGQGAPFTVEEFPIVGVVIRQMVDEESQHRSVDIVPVYLDPCVALSSSGGLSILEHDDHCNFYYSVVWCNWPEREDEKRLVSVKQHVTKEAEYEIEKRQKS